MKIIPNVYIKNTMLGFSAQDNIKRCQTYRSEYTVYRQSRI